MTAEQWVFSTLGAAIGFLIGLAVAVLLRPRLDSQEIDAAISERVEEIKRTRDES